MAGIGLVTAALALLSACGGGGGGGGGGSVATTTSPAVPLGTPPAPGVVTYPLQTAYRALISAGSTDNFAVTGDCNGTAQTINGRVSAATFEGVNGYSATENATLSIPDCSANVTSSTGTTYFDANFARLGGVGSDGSYTAVVGGAPALPASVKIGDSASIFAVYASYQDSTKRARSGQTVEGFAIEADNAAGATADSAIYHVTSQTFDGNNKLLTTQQSFYRITTGGVLTLLSLDIVYNSFVVSHFIYTIVR